jgi:tagatose 1,6-diphosphate aldolase
MTARDVAAALSRARALDTIANDAGVVVGVAIDHRDALQRALQRRSMDLDADAIAKLKALVTRILAPLASVVLLDVEHGVGPAIALGALPGTTALCTPLEAQGYGDVAAITQTTFLEDWSPQRARFLGASACKLLLPYRVDAVEQAERQDLVVRRAVDACEAAGVALILEPIVYSRPGVEPDTAARFAELVVEGAHRLARLRPAVLKLQYPGTAEACRELDTACGPELPWVLLGGGAQPAALLAQVEDACRAGAWGFIVGRTLWEAALTTDPGEAEQRLVDESVPLLRQLAAIARAHGVPWRSRLEPVPVPPAGWHTSSRIPVTSPGERS